MIVQNLNFDKTVALAKAKAEKNDRKRTLFTFQVIR